MLFPYSRLRGIEVAAETLREAERAGFYSCVLPHHLLPPRWPAASPTGKVWYDPLSLSAYFCARTSRLVFRTGVLVVPYLAPVALAKTIATLDIISGGRFRLGVGVGWMRAEFRRLGIPFEQRGAIAEEYVRAMRELWDSDAPSFSGEYVSFNDVSFLPRPASHRIPIDFGGAGAPAFRRVAELGDGWYPLALSPDAIASGVREIRRQVAARGRNPDEIAVTCSFAVDRGDPETAAMANHATAEGGVGADTRQEVPGLSSLSAAECCEGIEALRAAGVTDVTLEFTWNNPAELTKRLQWFSREVMPAFPTYH
jgi:probable F420-dependent oxidoreductase